MTQDRELQHNELDAVSGGNNKEFIEITEDELKQVAGGTSKLPGMKQGARCNSQAWHNLRASNVIGKPPAPFA
jgi:bacteriocin-like protein